MSELTISVVTATFNSEQTVADTIASVNSQSYKQVEHVFIDAVSTDATLKIIQDAARRSPLVVSEPDEGIYSALNRGLSVSNGDIVGFLHSDDLFAHDSVLERVAGVFDHPDVEACFADLDYVSREDLTKVRRRWRSQNYCKNKLTRGWMPPHPTFYVRRSVLENWAFDTRYRISADYDFMLRVLLAGVRSVYIPEVIVKMRLGGVSNGSFRNLCQKSREDLHIIRRHRLGGVSTLALKNLQKVRQFVPL
jgi:glycosyltransferase